MNNILWVRAGTPWAIYEQVPGPGRLALAFGSIDRQGHPLRSITMENAATTRLEISSNATENVICTIALRQKSRLFASTDSIGNRVAIFYTLSAA